MRILGLDISSKTGAVVLDFPENGKFTIDHVDVLKVGGGLRGMRRCSALASKMLNILENHNIDRVVLEGYGFAQKNSGIVLVEIGSILRYFLYQNGHDNYIEVPPTSLKKFVTGKGNAAKDTMIKEVYKRWDFDTDNNDIADAFGLAMFGAAWHNLIGMPKLNMSAVDDLKKAQGFS